MRFLCARCFHLITINALHAIFILCSIPAIIGRAGVSAQETIDHNGLDAVKGLAAGYGHLVEHYVPEFWGLDRDIIGRAEEDIRDLGNNAPGKLNINSGESQFWTFPQEAVQGRKSPATSGLPSPIRQRHLESGEGVNAAAELKKRQDRRTVYISLNTCDQPSAQSSNPGLPEQLKLYISTSPDNQKPDADKHDYTVSVDEGFGSIEIAASSDVYFGISAPTNDNFNGPYNYELTASIDDFYAVYHDQPNCYFVDSDSRSALLYTNDTVPSPINSSNPIFKEWMDTPPIFKMFLQNQENTEILGLQRSMCALQNHAQKREVTDFDTGMTIVGGGQPKQQFYAKGLNASSAYYAFIGIIGNATDAGGGVVNGGGTLWKRTNLTTKSGPNCALIYNLTFCSEVAYAVPSNATNMGNITALGEFYDDQANSLYVNFTKSLAQIPCNTTSSAQYSLAVTCDNCTHAYKQWLCAVTIPRCEDFSNTAFYLQPRAVAQKFINETYGAQYSDDPSLTQENKNRLFTNSSRNPSIDEVIAPGPYKEVLPCKALCYGLVQSCPAALGFSCPLEGHGLNYTYGSYIDVGLGKVSCNLPGRNMTSSASIGGRSHFAAIVAVTTTIWTIVT
ncbi:MAG: hypothetical protein Q9163_005022 [Psora crenata]